LANSPFLEIHNLHASVAGNEILRGVELTVNRGEVHAVRISVAATGLFVVRLVGDRGEVANRVPVGDGQLGVGRPHLLIGAALGVGERADQDVDERRTRHWQPHQHRDQH